MKNKEKVLKWIKANDETCMTAIISALMSGVFCYVGFNRGKRFQSGFDAKLIWAFRDKDVRTLIEHILELRHS